jgi:hypothetical protein
MKKISLLIALSLLFSHQEASPLDGILGSAAKITYNAATSDFAIMVYKYSAIAAASVTAKTLMEPALAQYRRATNTENVNEMLARAQLHEKFQQLDAADFDIQIAKMKILKDHFGDYQITMQKRLQAIKESDATEEEKQRLTLELEKRIKATEENIIKYNTSEFEKLVKSTTDKLKAHLRKQARTV